MSTQWVQDTLQSILQLLPDSGLILELEITDTVHRLGQLHDQLKEYSHRLFASGNPGFVDVVGQSSGARTRVHVHTPPTSYASVEGPFRFRRGCRRSEAAFCVRSDITLQTGGKTILAHERHLTGEERPDAATRVHGRIPVGT